MDQKAGMKAAGALAVLALLAAAFAQRPQASVPPSALPLRLTGVMLDQNAPARSGCLIRCTSPPERGGIFFAGQTVCDIAEVREVRADGVVIENLLAHRTELLTFGPSDTGPDADAPASPEVEGRTPAASTPTPSDVFAVTLTRSAIEGYLADLPALLDSAVTRPHFQESIGGQRTIDGYEIDSIKEGSPVHDWGFRNGDVVLDVNGEPLDGMATVMRLFGHIQSASQTKLTVLRNGRKVTFIFTTK